MKKYIGWIILGTLVLYLVSIRVPVMTAVPTLLSWLVPILMWPTLGKSAGSQALMLMGTGAVLLLFAAHRDVVFGWQDIFAPNLPLLGMFVAVSFLGLANTDMEDDTLPRGKKAVIITAFGTHLLGAVINLSVLFVFGDRLQKNGSLTRNQLIILPRSFCAAAWWSPFFVATGVALTYAPGMLWQETLIPGLLMSVIAITYSIVDVCLFKKEPFPGYPIRVESLTVPIFFAMAVLCVHYFRPDISIMNLISLISPLGALVFMKSRPRLPILHNFINTRLTSVSSQFALFLAAGVFSTGIKAITHAYPALFTLEGATFTPTLFAVLLGGMILLCIMGVHPIVSISVVSPLLIPLHPENSQLGFLFLSSWAISTACSPLSGVGLALVSRYRASAWGIIQHNWHYAIAMWAVASMVNVFFFH
ncbi:hypothetical protein SAMN02746065_104115 [Desulfocicer vacuolatum DSM 3385]|uniref:Uncharacterized protein n=1 Tax=Desulfocicer vacuolatum DSM 3385 TaxID=1121400 RepID=A0A1W2A4N5_9BACT|nr:hypothetical protein [Desulfocicer vacuolatum]SMC55620.1 hypothetical protein SAMN02746065_104115 [Desulfocicer vacuolatum DSM 3385]